jgi:DNA-binding protein H-NS
MSCDAVGHTHLLRLPAIFLLECLTAIAAKLEHLHSDCNHMSKLTALRKQIATLEAKAERITKLEMTSSIAKVKTMMQSLGVTVEHLGSNVSTAVKKMTGSKTATAKKTRAKRAGAGVSKYAEPKSGQTWTGFGRAPAWIASAKDRTVFLVKKVDGTGSAVAAKKSPKAVKTGNAAKPVKKAAGKVATKTKAVTKKVTRVAKTSTTAPSEAPAAAKNRAAKTGSAKKTIARKAPAKKNVPAKAEATVPATAE